MNKMSLGTGDEPWHRQNFFRQRGGMLVAPVLLDGHVAMGGHMTMVKKGE